MKLLTHNMLTSAILKNVKQGYPLKVFGAKVEEKSVEYNPDFLKRMVPKLDYSAVLAAAKDLGKEEGLPEEMTADLTENDEFLRKLHHVLMEVEVEEGHLECPETGRKFTISNGIPNMLLDEDEV